MTSLYMDLVPDRLKKIFPRILCIKSETPGMSETTLTSEEDNIVLSSVSIMYLFTYSDTLGRFEINIFSPVRLKPGVNRVKIDLF